MTTPDTTAVSTNRRAGVNLPVAARMTAMHTAAPPTTAYGPQEGTTPAPFGPIRSRGRVAMSVIGRYTYSWTFDRAITMRAAMFTSSVITNSTRPEAISVFTATPDDSGKLSAMSAAIVDGFAWLIRLNVTSPDTERMIATAIVSPRARPRPSMAPLITADLPNGRTVILIISQRVAPSASAPSWSLRGVCEKTSRATADTIGSVITASTTAATSIVRPVDDAGPLKNGMKPRWSSSHSMIGIVAGASMKMPQRP